MTRSRSTSPLAPPLDVVLVLILDRMSSTRRIGVARLRAQGNGNETCSRVTHG